MRGGGEFSAQVECDATQHTIYVQGGEGHGDINLGIKVGAAVGRYFPSHCSVFCWTCGRCMIPWIGVGVWRFCGRTGWAITRCA